jgi:MoxR-like ATPase
VRRSVPGASAPLIRDATEFIGRARRLDLDKAPGLAETIDWVSALAALGVTELAAGDVLRTIGTIAKTPDDRIAVTEAATAAIEPAVAEAVTQESSS